MISGRDIVFVSSIEWNFLWQVHQEIAFRFAAAGNRVLYIENTASTCSRILPRCQCRAANRLNRWVRQFFFARVREALPNIFASLAVSGAAVSVPGCRDFAKSSKHCLRAVARAARTIEVSRSGSSGHTCQQAPAIGLMPIIGDAMAASVVAAPTIAARSLTMLATNVASFAARRGRVGEDGRARPGNVSLKLCTVDLRQTQFRRSPFGSAVINLDGSTK